MRAALIPLLLVGSVRADAPAAAVTSRAEPRFAVGAFAATHIDGAFMATVVGAQAGKQLVGPTWVVASLGAGKIDWLEISEQLGSWVAEGQISIAQRVCTQTGIGCIVASAGVGYQHGAMRFADDLGENPSWTETVSRVYGEARFTAQLVFAGRVGAYAAVGLRGTKTFTQYDELGLGVLLTGGAVVLW